MDPEIETDIALVAGVLALDAQATRTLLQKAEAAAQLVARPLRSASERDDFVHRARLHLWNNDWRRLRAWRKQVPLSHYFGSIFANLRTDILRERGRDRLEPGHFGPGDDDNDLPRQAVDPDNEPDVEQLTSCLQEGLELVTPRQKRCLELRFFHNCSYEQIATELAIRIGTVGTNLLDAQRALLRRMTGTCGDLIAGMVAAGRGGR
jgi:RNA polymerase sigma factor (sigma-70 family)